MGNNGKLNEKERQFLDDYFGKTQTMMFEHAKELVEENNLPVHLIHDIFQTGYEHLVGLLATNKEYAAFVNKTLHDLNKDSFKLIDVYVTNCMKTYVDKLQKQYIRHFSVEQDFQDITGNLTFGQHLAREILLQEVGGVTYEDSDNSLPRSALNSTIQLMLHEPTQVPITSTRQIGFNDILANLVEEQYDLSDRTSRREARRESQIKYSLIHGKRSHKTSTNGDTQLKRYAKELGITSRWASRIAEYARTHQLPFANSLALVQQISSQPAFEQQFRAMYRQERAR